MTTKMITRDQYFCAYAFYNLACQKQKEVRDYEKLLIEIVGEGKITDSIYDPSSKGTKSEYDLFISEMGLMVEWKQAQNEFAKEKRREEKENVQEKGKIIERS